MPTEDDIKIIMSVLGLEKIEKAKQAIEQEEDAIRKLGDALAKNAISQAQFDTAATKSAQAIQSHAAAIKAAGGSFNGRALMEFSRAAEDAQYGLAGVLNNIPGLVQSLGGSSGLVGAISLAAVGGYQLYKHWDDLMGLFGSSKTQSEAAAMEELSKQTQKTAEEAERLARYQAVQKASKDISEPQTKEQKKTAEGVKEAIVEAGMKDIVAGMLKADPKAFDAAIPGIKGADGKVLQNDKGMDRNAIVDASDAQKKLDDYLSGKSRMRTDLYTNRVSEDAIDPAKLQALQIAKGEADRRLQDARKQAAQEQLAANAIPEHFQNNLPKTIERLEKDPAYLANLGPDKRAKLLNDLKSATPEGRAKNDQIDADEERAWDDLQASIKGVKEWSADFKKKVQEATRDRSFIGKADKDLTGPQAAAKKLHDTFETKVNASLKSRDFMATAIKVKNNEDLTPAQQEAARRDGDRRKQDSEMMEAQLKDKMTAWNKDWDTSHKNPQVFNGSASLRDAIQTAERTDKDPTAVQRLEELRKQTKYLETISQQRFEQGAAQAG